MVAEAGAAARPPEDMGYECWCGQFVTWEDFEEMSGWMSRTCEGTGTLRCYCGGDFCVCHNHGEVDCEGCPDCMEDDWL